MNTIYKKLFPLSIKDFRNLITIYKYNKNITYLDKYDKEIGYIEYKPTNGKICLFFITNPSYRNRGLGKQILDIALDDIKQHNTKRAWLVTANCPHKFWESNGFTYAKNPDNSVTMHGYIRDL
jgi:N-acetylglutamate synthase-like GNAT family acetyltransferase